LRTFCGFLAKIKGAFVQHYVKATAPLSQGGKNTQRQSLDLKSGTQKDPPVAFFDKTIKG